MAEDGPERGFRVKQTPEEQLEDKFNRALARFLVDRAIESVAEEEGININCSKCPLFLRYQSSKDPKFN